MAILSVVLVYEILSCIISAAIFNYIAVVLCCFNQVINITVSQ